MRIVFFGTPDFAVSSLERLVTQGHNIVAVVTVPDRPQGRGKKILPAPVKVAAKKHHIPILQPDNLKDSDFITTLRSYRADLQLIVAFKILPPEIFEMPPLGTINLHASLLPQYRGAAPINWAIINGETTTGVTTFFIEKTVDTGEILLQAEEKIIPTDTAGTLYDRLKEKGADLLLQTTQGIEAGTLQSTPQPKVPLENIKKAPKIHKADGEINWQQSAEAVVNFIRGLAPYPGAWTVWETTPFKILQSAPSDRPPLPPGQLRSDGKTFLEIGTQTTPLAILQLQMAGKKAMDIATFLRGHVIKNFTGTN